MPDRIPVDQTPPEPETAPEPQELIAGKFKSQDDLVNAYSHLEKKLGEQSSEVGDLRKQTQILTEQLSKSAPQEKARPEPTTDYEKELSTIYKALEDGDFSVEEALQKSNALTAQMVEAGTLSKAEARMQEILQSRDAQTVQGQFHKENPDFKELQQNGKLEEIKQTNPMHDDFSAYYAYKANIAKEEGRIQAQQLAAEETKTSKVLSKPGEMIRRKNKSNKPPTETELRESMLSALKKARGEE